PGFEIVEIENHQITLDQRPKRDSIVTALYEIALKKARDNVEIVFFGFKGVRPVDCDTVFRFNARETQRRRFAVRLVYSSTPATFSVKITGTRYQVSMVRYLLDASTGEYGSLKEIQYEPPVEYRFDPNLRKFDEYVLKFEKDRWQMNRAIIDAIKRIVPVLGDSMCLVLHADVHRTVYPSTIRMYDDMVTYLLENGWAKHTDETSRARFLDELTAENTAVKENERQRLADELAAARKAESRQWLLAWLVPASTLAVLLIVLLVLRGRVQSPLITTHRFDVILCYALYAVIVGLAVYFAWPFLGTHAFGPERMSYGQRLRRGEVFREIRKSNILKNFDDFTMLSRFPLLTPSGYGAEYTYKSKKRSTLGIKYQFTAVVWPDSNGFRLRHPTVLPNEAIEQFERNEKVEAYVERNNISRARIIFGTTHFLVAVRETHSVRGARIPISLDYDGSRDIITHCTFPPDFEDERFPEMSMLSRLLMRWGHTIKKSSCMSLSYKDSKTPPELTVLIDAGGDDTLHIIMQGDNSFRYWWRPVPKRIPTPQSIIDQILLEFTEAGLPPEYLRRSVKLVSALSFRRPDYFSYGKHDRVITHATFKLHTDCPWVDKFNDGEGVRFSVVYDYYSDSMKLGRPIGQPGRYGIRRVWEEITPRSYSMRPVRKIISREEARTRLFRALPDEKGFNSMQIRMNIPEGSYKNEHALCLVGQYESNDIFVDLETGDVIGPLHAAHERSWVEYTVPETHSYPYDCSSK
ncbi:MAG: hypothetical protein JSV53_12485, partial [candidate division WOR-3 bacterium]